MAKLSWRGAAGIAALTTGAGVFTNFLINYSLVSISQDPGEFTYNLLRFAGALYLTSILALKGISK